MRCKYITIIFTFPRYSAQWLLMLRALTGNNKTIYRCGGSTGFADYTIVAPVSRLTPDKVLPGAPKSGADDTVLNSKVKWLIFCKLSIHQSILPACFFGSNQNSFHRLQVF